MFARVYPKRRLSLWCCALLLAVAASLGSVALDEMAGLSLNPPVYACGSQSGGC